MSKMLNKPKIIKYFAIYCWHAYPTNPKLIELLISKDNKAFHSLGNFDLILKPGTQYFLIEDESITAFYFLKIVIKETYGGNRAYLNNIFLLEEINNIDYEIFVSDSRERNMPRKSLTLSIEKKDETDLEKSSDTQRHNFNKPESHILSNNTNISRNMSCNKIEKNTFEDKNNKQSLKNDIIDNMYLISDSDLTSRKEEDSSYFSKHNKFVNDTCSKIRKSNNKSNQGSGNDQRHFTQFKEISKSSAKYNNKYQNEIQNESKGQLNRNDLEDANDHLVEHDLGKNLRDQLNFYSNNDFNIVNNFSSDKSDKTHSNINISKVKYESNLNNDLNNISISMSNSKYQKDSSNPRQEISRPSDNISHRSKKNEKSNSLENYIHYYNNQENDVAYVKNYDNSEKLEQFQNSEEKIYHDENKYKSLNDQIKDMQNQIIKLTLDSDDRHSNRDNKNSINVNRRGTNRKNWNSQTFPNLEKFQNLKKNENYIDINNKIDLVNIKNSNSTNYKTPDEILSTIKSNYMLSKGFNTINRDLKSSNDDENKNSNANELERYLFNNESQLDDNLNTHIKKEFYSYENNNNEKENFYLGHEFKINQIENRISNMNDEINSMKYELNKINNNIQSLLETKTLLNKNNMDFILEKCKKLIESNFENYINKEENNNLNFLHNKKVNFQKNVEKAYEKYVDKLIEQNFQNLTNRIQDKIYNAILKPTVKKLENNLKTNLNEVKLHLKYFEKNKTTKSYKISSQEEIKKYYKTIYKVIEDLIDKLSRKEMILSKFEKENSLNFSENGNQSEIL